MSFYSISTLLMQAPWVVFIKLKDHISHQKVMLAATINMSYVSANSYSLRLCNSESDHQGPPRKEMAVDSRFLMPMVFL